MNIEVWDRYPIFPPNYMLDYIMIVNRVLGKKFSKKFLLAASAYRRQVKERANLDFSIKALEAQYEHETYGKPCPDPKVNGYTLGKWTMDVTIASMKEDYQNGLFSKYELMRGNSYLVRQQIKKWIVVKPFWY